MINILDPNDIVLAEIGTRLHLDQVERHLPGILQPMHAAKRDENRLILAEKNFLVIASDNGSSVDDHPMFSAVIVFLKRQLGAWIDGDALDLKAVSSVDRLIISPRPMDRLGLSRGTVTVRFQSADEFGDVLIPLL